MTLNCLCVCITSSAWRISSLGATCIGSDMHVEPSDTPAPANDAAPAARAELPRTDTAPALWLSTRRRVTA